jgi:paraquat-inducible protein B
MSVKANKTVIGAFVVGAVVLAVAGILAFGSGRLFEDTMDVAFYFDGSVKGLNQGAPVVLKGVKIGSVTDISMQFDIHEVSFQTEVLAELQQKITPVGSKKAVEDLETERDKDIEAFRAELLQSLHEKGLRGQLSVQSIVTGMLQVELDLHPGAAPADLVKNAKGYWVIPTMPSDMEKLTNSIQDAPIGEIMSDLRDSLDGINRLVNSAEVTDSLKHLDSALQGIDEVVAKFNDRFEGIDEELTELSDSATTLLKNLDEKYTPLADTIEGALDDTRKLVNNVDEQVKPLVDDVQAAIEDTRKLVNNADSQLEPLVTSIRETTKSADEVLVKAKESLEMLQGLAPPDSAIAYKFADTLDTLTDAMDNLKSLLAYLQQHPEALLRGK